MFLPVVHESPRDSYLGHQRDHESAPSGSIDVYVKKVLKIIVPEFLKATNEFSLCVDPKGRAKRDHIVAYPCPPIPGPSAGRDSDPFWRLRLHLGPAFTGEFGRGFSIAPEALLRLLLKVSV